MFGGKELRKVYVPVLYIIVESIEVIFVIEKRFEFSIKMVNRLNIIDFRDGLLRNDWCVSFRSKNIIREAVEYRKIKSITRKCIE